MNPIDQGEARPQKQYRSLAWILGAVVTYDLSWFICGYCMSYFNSIEYQQIHSLYQIPLPQSTAQGIFSGLVTFGAIFGSILAHFVLHLFSRKHCFYLGNFVILVSSIALYPKNYALLALGRVLQGINIGFMTSINSIMVKQLVPVSLSSYLSVILYFFFNLGYGFSFMLSLILKNSGLNISEQTTVIFIVPLIFASGIQQVILCLIYTNETPKYLLTQGRDEQAVKLLQKIYKPQFSDQIYQEKLKDLQAEESILWNQAKQAPEDTRTAKFIGYFLTIFQQFTGINVVVLFGSELAVDFMPALKDHLSLILSSQKILLSIIGLIILKYVGRRTMMIAGTCILSATLLSTAIGFWLPQGSVKAPLILGSFVVYLAAFVVSFGPIPFAYASEVVQPKVVPAITIAHWVASCAVIVLFPLITASCGAGCPPVFLFFFGCMLLTLVAIKLTMVETKGKTEFQIREQFSALEKSHKYGVMSQAKQQQYPNIGNINKQESWESDQE